MGAVRTFWARVSSRISAVTRASKVALAAVALPLLILGITAVPSGRALAQPVPYRPATQAVVTAKLGTAVQFTATQLAAFHAFHLHHLAHMAHLRALAEAKAALVTTVSVTSHASSIAGDSEGAGDSDGTVTTTSHASAPSQSSGSGGGYSVSSAFQACVIRAESGGNPNIWNASGHWGLYQFSASTWALHGGDPALFGHASAAYQTQIFWNTYNADGTSDWSPYDGC